MQITDWPTRVTNGSDWCDLYATVPIAGDGEGAGEWQAIEQQPTMTAIHFKEQTSLTIQDRPNAPFHSGCKLFSWACDGHPIKVGLTGLLELCSMLRSQGFASVEFDNDCTAFLSIKVKEHPEGTVFRSLRRSISEDEGCHCSKRLTMASLHTLGKC